MLKICWADAVHEYEAVLSLKPGHKAAKKLLAEARTKVQADR